MSRSGLRHAVLAVLLLAPFCRSAAAQTYTLQKMVVLARHSVRPPDLKPTELAKFTDRTWPDLGLTTGGLTARGVTDAKLLGAYARAVLSQDGLLAPTGCPRPDDLFIWSDNRTLRTVTTGTMFGEGAYPGCNVSANSFQGGSDDPLFKTVLHPRKQPHHGDDTAQLTALRSALGADQNPCLVKTPTANPDRTCSVASDLADEFRLEYVDGLDYPEVGFGVVDDVASIENMLALYTHFWSGTYALPRNGRRNAAALATQMSLALTAGSDATGAQAARLLVYVGHDSTLASMRGLLHARWKANVGRANDTPPLSALMLALLSDDTGAEFVEPLFLTVGPDQLRNATPLTLTAPPDIVKVEIPGCTTATTTMCPLDTFTQLVAASIAAGSN